MRISTLLSHDLCYHGYETASRRISGFTVFGGGPIFLLHLRIMWSCLFFSLLHSAVTYLWESRSTYHRHNLTDPSIDLACSESRIELDHE